MNIVHYFGESSLMMAAVHGDVNIVKTLIQAGADLNR